MCRAKVLGDLLNSINILNGYYNAAPNMHRTPMRMVYDTDKFGIRFGTTAHELTPEEEEWLLKEMEEDEDAKEEAPAELKEDPACSSSKSNSSSNYENFDNIGLDKEDSLGKGEKEMIRSGKAMIVGRDKRTGELIIDDHPDDFWTDGSARLVGSMTTMNQIPGKRFTILQVKLVCHKLINVP
jgi:hypothetical protein